MHRYYTDAIFLIKLFYGWDVMRKIKIVVGNIKIGQALTWAYPAGDPSSTIYIIPTYEVTVSGIDDKGVPKTRKFEALRFGVQKKTASSSDLVVGLANTQTHIIKSWIPTYTVHSSTSTENGAWQVYDSFLIHDGPDNVMNTRNIYASIGCVEIVGGPQGFVAFNDFIIELSGASAKTKASKLIEIGKAKSISITYLAAARPNLKLY